MIARSKEIRFLKKSIFHLFGDFFFYPPPKPAVGPFFKNEMFFFSQTLAVLGQLYHAEHVSDTGWVVKHHRRDVWSIKVQTFGSKYAIF